MPMRNNIRNARRGAVAEVKVGAEAIDLSTIAGKDAELLMNTLQVVNSDGKVVGKYVDGEIFFNDGATTATIENGIVTFTGAKEGYKMIVGIDKTTEKDGKNTIKVKPATETLQVSAQPRRIHLEQSYED